MPFPLIGIAAGAVRAAAAFSSRWGVRTGATISRGPRFNAQYALWPHRYARALKQLSGQLTNKQANKRGRYVGGSLDIDMAVQYRDIEQSLKAFEGKIKKYALERSFNDVERLLAAETIKAVRSVPHGRRGKLSKKKYSNNSRWIRMRGGLTKSKFKRRAIGQTKHGGFRLLQGVSKVPLHWMESGTYDGRKWKGFPKGTGPRMGTALKMRKQMIRIVSQNMKKQVDHFRATGKLATAKDLRSLPGRGRADRKRG